MSIINEIEEKDNKIFYSVILDNNDFTVKKFYSDYYLSEIRELLNEKEKEETINESKILQKLDHQNIIKFIDFFINKEKKTLNIVTEYADGGDLSEKINKQPKKNLFPGKFDLTNIAFPYAPCPNSFIV